MSLDTVEQPLHSDVPNLPLSLTVSQILLINDSICDQSVLTKPGHSDISLGLGNKAKNRVRVKVRN